MVLLLWFFWAVVLVRLGCCFEVLVSGFLFCGSCFVVVVVCFGCCCCGCVVGVFCGWVVGVLLGSVLWFVFVVQEKLL